MVKDINIKHRRYCFFNDVIELKDFDSSLSKITRWSNKSITVYYVSYITIKKISECDNIKSVNPLYLMICGVIGHTEEKNGGKYLVVSPDN